MQSTNISGGFEDDSFDAPAFAITENAAKELERLKQTEKPGAMLRISVDGGGCSGFKYNFDFVLEKNSDDQSFTRDSAEVLIDETSLDFIRGSVLDFEETLGSAEFVIKNPNASATCGCGSSFAV